MLHYLIFYCAMSGLATDSISTIKQDTSQTHCPPPPFFVSNAYTVNCESSQCMWFDIKYAVDYYSVSLYDRWGEQVINYSGTHTDSPNTDMGRKFEGMVDENNKRLLPGNYVIKLTLKPVGASEVSYCWALVLIR